MLVHEGGQFVLQLRRYGFSIENSPCLFQNALLDRLGDMIPLQGNRSPESAYQLLVTFGVFDQFTLDFWHAAPLPFFLPSI